MSNAADNPCLSHDPLPRDFYERSAVEVAPDLVGKLLVRKYQHTCMSGIILEAEAYQGESDLGCHAKAGKTPRTAVMYGPPGHAYVYFTYGMHWMLNAVTEKEGVAAAVLIRAILPVYGLEAMRKHRPTPPGWSEQRPDLHWTDGPAKLCQALRIDRDLNSRDLCSTSTGLWICDTGIRYEASMVGVTPRIGMNTVPEPWFSIPWRWVVKPDARSRIG